MIIENQQKTKIKNKILLFGHKGYLGACLFNRLKTDILFNTVDDLIKMDCIPEHDKYDLIINCVGKPDVEYCEKNETCSFIANYMSIVQLRKLFPKSKIIHFSSYYVYDSGVLCTEQANTTKKYNYMKHKLMGESFILKTNSICFRLGKLFGGEALHNNDKLTSHILTNKDIIVDKVLFNPTSIEQILRCIYYVAKNSFMVGLFNLANKGITTHAEYVNFVCSNLQLSRNIKIIEKRNRIFNNYGKFAMDTAKIEKHIQLAHWETDLKQFLNRWKNKNVI